MNPILFSLLFILSWVAAYAIIRYLMIEEYMYPISGYRGSPLWLVVAAIVFILCVWGSVATIRYTYFFPVEEEMRSGVVMKHQYDPPYTTHGFMMVGRVMVPQTYYHPARYWTLIDGKSQTGSDLKDWVDVGQNTYETFSDGDSIYFKPTVQ